MVPDREMKTILVVDDQADAALCPFPLLKERGFKHDVVLVKTGAEALDFLKARGVWKHRDVRIQPELVLVGLRMRRAYDVAFLRELRENPLFRYLVIVFLAETPKDAERAQEGNIHPHLCLRKPKTPADLPPLAERLHELLA